MTLSSLPLLLLLLLLSASLLLPSQGLHSSFSFSNFDRSASSALDLRGGAAVSGSAVTLPPGRPPASATCTTPVAFGRRPSFSASLAFSLPSTNPGVALFASPSAVARRGALAVEFSSGRVRVRVGDAPVASGNASALVAGGKLRSWVDYRGEKKVLEVRLVGIGGKERPLRPTVAFPLDLSSVVSREAMYVGVSSLGGGNFSEGVRVYSWSFGVTSAGPYTMHSEPLDPVPIVRTPRGPVEGRGGGGYCLGNLAWALGVGAACGAALGLVVASLRSFRMERHPVAPVDCAAGSGSVEFKPEKEAVVAGGKGEKEEEGGREVKVAVLGCEGKKTVKDESRLHHAIGEAD